MEPKKAIEQLKDMAKDVWSKEDVAAQNAPEKWADDLEAIRAGIRALEAVEGIRRLAEQEVKTVREAVSVRDSQFEQGILSGTEHMKGLIDCWYTYTMDTDIEEGE